MNHSAAIQAFLVLLSSASLSSALDYVWTGKGDAMKLSAPTEPVKVRLAKSVKLTSVSFDPGALNAIEIQGEPLELADGSRVEFLKLPGDVGMGKTASATISSDLKLSGRVALMNQNRHYLGGEKLLITGAIKGDGKLFIGGVKGGIVQLTGDNSGYLGRVIIESGSLMLGHSSVLGSGQEAVTLKGGALVMGARVSTIHDLEVLANAEWDAHGPNGTHDGRITIHKGAVLTVKNGGGNTTTWRGEVSGPGNLVFTAHGTTFAGDRPNTLQGTVTIAGSSRGATIMARTTGTDVVPRSLVMTSNGTLRWAADEQIADSASVTFQGEVPTLELAGHKERAGILDLQGDARIDLGQNGELSFSDSSGISWHPEKVVMIEGHGTIRFGEGEPGLTKEQLRQIGFVNPVGQPAGTYTARLSKDGKLLPTNNPIVPENLPVDLSAQADARRRALYEVEGLLQLTGGKTPLTKPGTVISFYGDSITWGGGYLNLIGKAISESERTKDLGIKLVNHGVNGGGVLTLRDGDKGTAHYGNRRPRPFAETIAEDKPDVVVISIGVNDVWWRKTSPGQFEKALTDLVVRAKKAGARPVLATLAIMKEKVGERNAKCDDYAGIARKVARDTDATLVDLRSAFMACMESESIVVRPGGAWTSDGKLLAHDGVHPNARGNRLLAELIAQGISRSIKDR